MVPEGWMATQIGDVAKFTSGGTPSKQNIAFWGGNKPWISGKDLKTHYLENSIDTLTDEGFKVAKKAPKGASLILVRGMTLLKDFPVGYAVKEVAFNQDLKALTPYENIDGLFLSFLLVAEKNKIRQLVSTAGHGTGRLDTESIQKYPVNIPPISEQKKIAQILATWDKAIATTEQLIANSQQQKKALMQQLLTGKKRLLDDNGVRFSDHFKRYKLADLVKIDAVNINSKTPDDFKFDYISLSDVNYGAINKELARHTYKNAPSRARRIVSEEDILFATVRPNLQAFAKITKKHSDCVVSTGFAVLSTKKNTCSDYVYQYLFSAHITGQINALVVGTNYPAINSSDVAGLNIYCPTHAEQQKIASVLSTADQEVEALQQKLTHLNQEKKALMQQLLTGKRRVKV